MESFSLAEILSLPLTPFFGMVLVLVGIYSVTFNVSDANTRNHKRAAKTALIGGGLYILGGSAIMLYRLLF